MKELKKYDRVLVRNHNTEPWSISIFIKENTSCGHDFKYECNDFSYIQCIPYKGNEYLLNTKNAPKKCSLDTKWKPKRGELYWFITDIDNLDIYFDIWYSGYGCDLLRHNSGNCFRTESEAKAMAEKIKELLKNK